MAIVEFHGGPITHRYLMRKTKDDLISLYFEYGKILLHAPLSRDDLRQMSKDCLANEVLKQVRRLPADGA